MMKPTGSNHSRIPITAWQRDPNAKNSIVLRIKKITHELELLQSEMHGQFTESSSKKTGIFEDTSAAETLNSFKAELDQFRRILWFYIEQAAGSPAKTIEHQPAPHGPQRVNEVLRALTPQPSAPGVVEHVSGSFFERLNLVIDTYMQEKKPVVAETTVINSGNTKASS
ncbi:MAG TPA: hypothetical protein VFT65_05900 [Candidatus Angelobacter sp.]|nr:hypothetical protein [Candidatus Angelobacter sp.]